MHLTSTAVFSLAAATTALADLVKLNQQFKDNWENYSNSAGLTRSMQLDSSSIVMNLDQYGCWCYFGDMHGKGRGSVVDELDGLCRVLAQNYDCALIDTETNGEACAKPWDEEYNPLTRIDVNVNIEKECFKLNKKRGNANCAQRACMIEGSFIHSLLAFFFGGGSLDKANKHDNGFDVESSCPIQSSGPSEVACCGSYPTRFPYRTKGGERDCCNGRTYNSITLQCCEDGKTKTVC